MAQRRFCATYLLRSLTAESRRAPSAGGITSTALPPCHQEPLACLPTQAVPTTFSRLLSAHATTRNGRRDGSGRTIRVLPPTPSGDRMLANLPSATTGGHADLSRRRPGTRRILGRILRMASLRPAELSNCSLGGWQHLQPSLFAPENLAQGRTGDAAPCGAPSVPLVPAVAVSRSTGPGATALLRGRWCLTAVKLGSVQPCAVSGKGWNRPLAHPRTIVYVHGACEATSLTPDGSTRAAGRSLPLGGGCDVAAVSETTTHGSGSWTSSFPWQRGALHLPMMADSTMRAKTVTIVLMGPPTMAPLLSATDPPPCT